MSTATRVPSLDDSYTASRSCATLSIASAGTVQPAPLVSPLETAAHSESRSMAPCPYPSEVSGGAVHVSLIARSSLHTKPDEAVQVSTNRTAVARRSRWCSARQQATGGYAPLRIGAFDGKVRAFPVHPSLCATDTPRRFAHPLWNPIC